MKISIYLSKKRINKERKIPIYFRLSHGMKRSEISTGIYIEKRFFSESKKQVLSKHPFSENFNRQIIQTHGKLLDIVYNLKSVDIEDPSIVKEVFQGDKKINLSNYIKTLPPFIEWARTYIQLKYQKKYNSKKVYSDAVNYLEKFEFHNKTTIHQINNSLAKRIYDFFITNNRTHYLEKIKFLAKEFCNQFEEENHLSKYRVPTVRKYFKNALTQKEFQKVIDFTPTNPRSKIFHDLFLFQYYSAGSRFGDALKLKWTDIEKNQINRVEEKTEKERAIPLNNSSIFIINKYKGNRSEYVFDLDQPTGKFTNQEWSIYKSKILSSMNSYLKTMKECLYIKTHISSHTSRHTFASHCFEKTQDIKSTSLLIGHSMLATTERYVHTDENDNKKLFKKVYGNTVF